MSRATVYTGLVFLLLGVSLFLWKSVGLGLPLVPSSPEGLWDVELEITARGLGQRGSLRAALPSTRPGQVVFDEHSASDRLLFTIRTENGERTGVWSGRLAGVHRVVHGFRVELAGTRSEIPSPPVPPAPPDVMHRYGRATAEFPASAVEVDQLLEALELPPETDPGGRLRVLFGFVASEIVTTDTGSDDALVTLAAREGRPEGVTRLLVTLLRAAGIPSRPAVGLRLRPDAHPKTVTWAEAWIAERWVPASPTEGFFANRPRDILVLRTGSLTLVESSGATAVGHRYQALPENLRPEELAVMMVPGNRWLASISLYRLPVPTQTVLRPLLLLPLGALVVALFRNVVGVPTFGTFMPVLLAFAFRGISLGLGLALVGVVIALGIGSRLVLDRLRLLLVPRLSILLCVVVLGVTAFAVLARGFGTRDLAAAVLFPMVILTMLIERFCVVLAEEGVQQALIRMTYSVAVAVAVYPIFTSETAEHLMFGFPELVLCVIGVLVWIGGYTGYRVTDLVRFRTLARAAEAGRA